MPVSLRWSRMRKTPPRNNPSGLKSYFLTQAGTYFPACVFTQIFVRAGSVFYPGRKGKQQGRKSGRRDQTGEQFFRFLFAAAFFFYPRVYQLFKHTAAFLIVFKLVKRGAGRRKQHDVAFFGMGKGKIYGGF